jgi:hypothetical protein
LINFCNGGLEEGSDKKRKHSRKCIKQRSTPINLVLGEEVKMHKVVQLEEMALVEGFLGHYIGDKGLKKWMVGVWKTVLGYDPITYVLSRGWLAFYFQSASDASKIMVGSWL